MRCIIISKDLRFLYLSGNELSIVTMVKNLPKKSHFSGDIIPLKIEDKENILPVKKRVSVASE